MCIDSKRNFDVGGTGIDVTPATGKDACVGRRLREGWRWLFRAFSWKCEVLNEGRIVEAKMKIAAVFGRLRESVI